MHNGDTHEDDANLIEFFQHFESIIDGHTPNMDQVASGTDFYVFREYLVKDIREIQQQLGAAPDDRLLEICEHLFNIIEWVRLINGTRSQDFGDALERVFEQEFSDKHILQSLYGASIDRWLKNKNGRYALGGNTYTIFDNAIFYRDRFGQWLKVEKETAFDLQPNKQLVDDEVTVSRLEPTYQPTPVDDIIAKWDDQGFRGTLPDDFLQFNETTTSPEEYFDFTLPHIKSLLDNPVSIQELERWSGNRITNLEDTIKLCLTVLDTVKGRRRDDSHTVYLLRDCLVFYEAHKALDLLEQEATSSDQLMIGRNFLSHKPGLWGHYIVTLEALYEAHRRHPDDFTKFYDEYCRLLNIFASVNPRFMALVNDMMIYIGKHIQTTKQKVIIFDVGFQGSINLLIQYVIDRHINPTRENKLKTEIELCVGAQWSKDLFKDRFKGDYFPFLNRVQSMARSDELYHYEFGSFNKETGSIQVKMGNEDWQRKAAVELVVLIMITKLSQGPRTDETQPV